MREYSPHAATPLIDPRVVARLRAVGAIPVLEILRLIFPDAVSLDAVMSR